MSSGVDTTYDVHPILVDEDGRPYVLITDGTTDAGIDPETGGLTVSRAIHQRVLDSNMWMVSYRKVDLIWVYNNSGATSDVVIQIMWHEE